MGIPLVYVLKGTHPLVFICTVSFSLALVCMGIYSTIKAEAIERGACQRPGRAIPPPYAVPFNLNPYPPTYLLIR